MSVYLSESGWLVADSLVELRRFAGRARLKQAWFSRVEGVPGFQVPAAKMRRVAVVGAVQLGDEAFGKRVQAIRLGAAQAG